MKRLAQYLVLGLLLLTATPVVHAEGFEQGPGFKFIKVLMDLDLTEQQQTQAANILKAHRPELRSGFDSVKTAHEVLFDTIHRDTYDEQAVRAASQDLAKAEEEFAVTRARVVSEMRNILTTDQKSTLANLRDDVRGDINGKIGFVRGLIDRWIDNHVG